VAVRALYENSFKDACGMDWTQDEATMELAARLEVINRAKPGTWRCARLVRISRPT
jgi:hypothetical protein